MTAALEQTYHQAVLNLVLFAATLVACAGLLTVSALAPAPELAQPFIVVVCVGFTAAIAACAPESLRVLRSSRDALGDLRRQLDQLPEVEHPLGL
jgi:hypothetical protein